MDGHRLSQLRKKLQALNYKELLEDSSAPLVDKLVTDLLHTTDSYRDLKLQVANKSQEIEDGRHKVCSVQEPLHYFPVTCRFSATITKVLYTCGR